MSFNESLYNILAPLQLSHLLTGFSIIIVATIVLYLWENNPFQRLPIYVFAPLLGFLAWLSVWTLKGVGILALG